MSASSHNLGEGTPKPPVPARWSGLVAELLSFSVAVDEARGAEQVLQEQVDGSPET